MDRFTSFNCNYRLYHKELNKKQPKKKNHTQSTKHDYLGSTATKHCIYRFKYNFLCELLTSVIIWSSTKRRLSITSNSDYLISRKVSDFSFFFFGGGWVIKVEL